MNKLEWLRERKKGIGGSDVGAILGVNKWKTAFQVYLEKTEEITDINEQNESAYWGDQFEEVVAREFSKRTGKKVRRDTRHFEHPQYKFMVANIDRRIVGENAILECKTANQYLSKEWENDEIPASYLLQVQHYLAVTRADKGYIAVLIGGQKFIWKEIDRDEELINMIIEAEKEFWKLVEDRTPPALDGSSVAEKWVNERFQNAQDEEIQLSIKFKDKIDNYFELKEKKTEIENEIKEIENNIKLEMETAEKASIKNYEISWKQVKSNRVDSKLLKSKYPDIYENVLKENKSRRFSVKGIESNE